MDFHEKGSLSAFTSETCTRLYIGDVEIVIDNLCEEETDSCEESMLVHHTILSFFLEDFMVSYSHQFYFIPRSMI